VTGGGRVLVVEDDQLLREALEEILVDEGIEVRTAANGAEALAYLDTWEPDLILLDLMMPVMDGFAFREAHRERGIAPRSRLLVLSAARDLDGAAAQVDADGYLPKPFRLEEVLGAVHRLLGGGAGPGAPDGARYPAGRADRAERGG
jgi:two-component system, chemotaxis family, chemotaxis protein CheY